MSFLKNANDSFPDQERRHYAPDQAPRAARSTLGPGMVPAEAEPDAWGHHVSRSHVAHAGNYAVLPPPGATAQANGAAATAAGMDPNFSADVRWQSNYQRQGQNADPNDDVGKPTRRRGKKVTAIPPGGSAQSPFNSPARSTLVLGSEAAIHDGTSKNSAHIPGYSGHISAANQQLANNVTARRAHDKSLFAENYASMMNKMGGRL